ncbi:MAG: 1-phosphofructokinase family hexose kinase [Clostridiales bacterium]|jgi:1-phosphofructokinase|nr:1-phosphofructokinase family hexose kinase [Clostridiales bacterium]
MAVTVTLNPCFDRTLAVSGFHHGGVNRVLQSRQDMGGKGINVSAALKALGLPTICLGFHFEDGAEALENMLESQNIPGDFVLCPGAVRVNTKIFEQDTGVMTELNERGAAVSRDRLEALLEKARAYAQTHPFFVISGSVPPGTPADFYQTLIKTIREANPAAFVALDAEGSLLLNGLKARPQMIKPNRFELESLVGTRLDSRAEILQKCRELIGEGVQLVCVSLGGDGAVIASAESAYFSPPMKLNVKSLHGAGDNMLAGACKGILENRTLEDILRCAAAAAAGSLEREGTLPCRKQDFDRLYPLARAEPL